MSVILYGAIEYEKRSSVRRKLSVRIYLLRVTDVRYLQDDNRFKNARGN